MLYLNCNKCGMVDIVKREEAKDWYCPNCPNFLHKLTEKEQAYRKLCRRLHVFMNRVRREEPDV